MRQTSKRIYSPATVSEVPDCPEVGKGSLHAEINFGGYVVYQALFVPQSNHWIDPHRAPGRK